MNPEKKFEPIIEFLLGSGEFESQWFGEVPDGEPKFWWRSKLREYAEKHEAKPDSGWIPVTDRPLFEETENGWVATKDGDQSLGFMAAIEFTDNKTGKKGWWIRHCILEDFTGLCVVGDDCNEPAGWTIDDVMFWKPIEAPTTNP